MNNIKEKQSVRHSYDTLDIVTRYIEWERQQKQVVRGGQVMYDLKGSHMFLYMHELYDFWYKNIHRKLLNNHD